MEDAPVSNTETFTFNEQADIIKRDLQAKFQREDWHGVMDCAADLRELEAYVRGFSAL